MMKFRQLTSIFLTASLVTSSAETTVGYNSDVRPILSDKCFLCHGPDKANNKAGLRLDTPEGAYAALKESPGKHAVVPGSLEKSETWKRINSTDPDEIMPTPKSNLKLTAAEKDILKKWIEQGAEYQPHWSFVNLPDEVPVPKIKDQKWARNAIDSFVEAKLESEGLQHSPEADPQRWLRRVTFSLTGLPPTLAEQEAFRQEFDTNGEKAYEHVVDRLMNTIEYAEHMTLDWLDAARYADTFGYHSDMNFTPWPYRDWVVKAFKEDMPYNQFVTWNLAGDLLPNATREQKLATAFNRLNRITNEGGSNWLEFFVDGVADRVHTAGTAFLGLTMECSKCHDHKYDPILAKDYYQLFSFFNSINETGVYNHGAISPPPSLLLPTPDQKKDLAARKKKAADLEAKMAKMKTDLRPGFQTWKKALLTPKAQLPFVSQPEKIAIADQTSHLNFDKNHKEPFESRIQPSKPREVKDKKGKMKKLGPIAGKLSPPPGADIKASFVEGPKGHGSAVKLDGDNGVVLKNFFKKERYTPFTIGLWIKDTLRSDKASVVAQRTHGHDVGYNGLDLKIQDGYLTARIFRSWPDNGIGVRTVKQVPKNKWHHITWTWDGSGQHDGFALYLDGQRAETTNLGDQLYKSVNVATYQIPGNFIIGSLFRGRGFQGGHIDEVTTFDRSLTPVEVRHIAGATDINDSLKSASEDELLAYFVENHHPEYRKTLAQLEKAYKEITKREDSFLEIPVMEENPEPRPAYVLNRGDFDAPRTDENRVERDTPSFLLPFPEGAPRDRLGLAQWLTLPNHPLTTRVYVNRIWQQFFGRGIVGTAENFGLQGDLPTHPELLDWLCRDFIKHGWSTKHLIKQIVLSSTYRQNSKLTPELREKDIANLLLARGPAYRLSGEQIRDSALASSGLLSDKRGGPPIKPYDPIRNANPSLGQVHRRSLYTYWRRTRPQNNMIIFDKPSLEVCSVKRTRTNSPAQALVLLNDTQFVEAARNLATSTLQEDGDDQKRIAKAWKKVTSREATEAELRILTDILKEQREHFKTHAKEAKKLLAVGLKPMPKDLDPIEAAAMTVTCQAIYNSDAAIWSR